MWLDITIRGTNKTATLKSLIEFVDDDHLKWQIFFEEKRPNNFVKETSDNTIILKRKK
jgi:hypothetical protein